MTRKKNTAPTDDSSDAAERGERLQKVLAAAGLGSRRGCEELILTGRVEVDRQVVNQLGARVLPGQEVRVDGQKLPQRRRVYYALHKPAGVISTNRDPSGRTRVIDLIDTHERLFAVGRLDKSSEGLILVTNDGALAQRLTHPKFEVEKTYRVEVAGQLSEADIGKLQSGVHLAEGFAKVERIRIRKTHSRSTDLEMVLKEGKNREVRRVFAAIGHKVVRLIRIAIGPLRLGELPAGAHRPLHRDEVQKLRESAGEGGRKKRKPSSDPGGAPKAGAKPYRPRSENDRTPHRASGYRSGDTAGKRPGKRPDKQADARPGERPRLPKPGDSLGTIIGVKLGGAKPPGKRAAKPPPSSAGGQSAANGPRSKSFGKKPAKKGGSKNDFGKRGGASGNKGQNRFRGGRSS